METNYLPLRVSTLRGDQPIDFSAYIKINDRYILYLRKGDSFEGQRLQRLREKKLKKMYIIPEDESNYRTYLSRNLALAFDPLSGKTLEVRCEIVQGIQQNTVEAIFENSESPEHYNKAKEDAERFVQFISNEARAAGIILKIDNIDRSVAHHGVTVSTLATAVAHRTSSLDKRQLQMLALGGLIHDIEHFKSAVDVCRPLAELNPEELKYYQFHPSEGAWKLQNLKHVDPQVLKIISQHEEYVDGNGFPNQLKMNELDPLSIFVAGANALDRMIAFEGIPKAEAGKKFLVQMLGRYPLEHMKALVDIVNSSVE